MTIHRHFRDDAIFATTVDTVADQLDISAKAVEKDYWVSQILRVLEIEFSGSRLSDSLNSWPLT